MLAAAYVRARAVGTNMTDRESSGDSEGAGGEGGEGGAGGAVVEVRVRLVVEDPELEHSPDMLAAKHLCEQYRCNGILSEWITKDECFEITDFTKTDMFVLEEFSGEVFKKLSQTKAVVVGPKCLSCCLTEGSEIPPGPSPIFTVAMRGLIITISGLNYNEKAKLKQYISWMGGRYESMLTEETTHLISNTVISDKYIKASCRGVPLMRPNWVEATWKASLEKNISATNPQFYSFKMPIFYGIVACSSGLDKRVRKKLEELLKNNGATHSKNFETAVVNILILDQNGMGSEKHKAAVEYGKICTTPSWIYDSVEAGYALDYRKFALTSNPVLKTSSPNRPSQLPDMSLNVSTIKNIRTTNFVDDTCSTTSSDSTMQPSTLQSVSTSQRSRHGRLVGPAKEFANLIDSIDLKDVKRAGLFLDGCCVYAYGMSGTRRDRVQRVVSRAGGVRYDEPSDAVTHLVCGDPSVNLTEDQLACMPRAVAVTVCWLTDSLQAGKTVDEALYLVSSNAEKSNNASSKLRLTKASPMSKRNLQLLQSPSCRPPVPLFSLDRSPEKNDIVQHYRDQHSRTQESLTLCNNVTKEPQSDTNTTVVANDAPPNSTVNDDRTVALEEDVTIMEEAVLFFDGLSFELHQIEDDTEEIIKLINDSGGTVAKREGISSSHYIIVPITCDNVENANKQTEVVTINWLIDCSTNEALVPIEYYHRPIIPIPSEETLSGLVFAISTYAGNERSYLAEVAQLLGAIVQPSLYRRESSSTKRSTHLICSEPSGAKYTGAVSWGLPVVNHQWLLDCLAAGKRIREGSYLLGDSVEPAWPDDVDDANTSETNGQTKSIVEPDPKSPPEPELLTINELKSVEKRPQVSDVVNIDNENVMEPCVQPINNTPTNSNILRRKSFARLSLDKMSPASKYIAMARQGFFGTESQETPKKTNDDQIQLSEQNDSVSTPSMENALATPNLAVFSSTSKRRILAIKHGQRPSNPLSTPVNIFDVASSTPESPFGAMLRPDTGKMSVESRKKLNKLCDQISLPVNRHESKSETPLSELRNRFFSNQLNREPLRSRGLIPKQLIIEGDAETPSKRKLSTEPGLNLSDTSGDDLQNQLRHLDMVLTGAEGSSNSSTPRSAKRKRTSAMSCMDNADSAGCVASQVDTVGWDDMSEPVKAATAVAPKIYKFILSTNVGNHEEIKHIIERLGGFVSGHELDLNATHLLCQNLARSEKLIGCLANRKWIVHPDFIIRSQEAGRFVDEELYEWGNPKFLVEYPMSEAERKLAKAIHRGRSEREWNSLPFSTFKVIVHMLEARKRPILRVLQAGGGEVIDFSPPFKGEITATHCFVEQSRLPLSSADLKYMSTRRIPVCQPLFLNHYLVNDPPPKPMDFSYPEYTNLLCE